MKTSELTGAALDWAVAKCKGVELIDGCYNRLLVDGRMSMGQSMLSPYKPSTNWAQGGAIIEREGIAVWQFDDVTWRAIAKDAVPDPMEGPTPLIAVMRCYVASKLGDDIELSEGLTDE